MSAPHGNAASPFRQPRAVWAVAFACVISFMGIGLVDPILPALADSLHATPSQVSLLFSSYLIVTAVAMLFVGWFSSRFGAKRTLVIGLADQANVGIAEPQDVLKHHQRLAQRQHRFHDAAAHGIGA